MRTTSLSSLNRPRIIVLGYLIRGPLGGLAWHHLQYVLGLRRLGYDVTFLEDSDDYPSCSHTAEGSLDIDPAEGLQFATETFSRIGFEKWSYFDAHTSRWIGPHADRARESCRAADLVLNLSGVNPLRPWFLEIPVRVLVDTDPLFTQIRHLEEPSALSIARAHTAFFTFGENIPRGLSLTPDDGLPWQATRQPIDLDSWPVTQGPIPGSFTTVMQWESYRNREYGGLVYGMKSDSFAMIEDLPAKVDARLELALAGATGPRDRLRCLGWHLRDPAGPTRSTVTFQRYLQESFAEFSVAKHGYVASRCGWFSERSANYLASGRPVVVQDTGFTAWMQTGSGVLTFRDLESAIHAIESVQSGYLSHCQAAREIAENYFAGGVVLSSLIERAMATRSWSNTEEIPN